MKKQSNLLKLTIAGLLMAAISGCNPSDDNNDNNGGGTSEPVATEQSVKEALHTTWKTNGLNNILEDIIYSKDIDWNEQVHLNDEIALNSKYLQCALLCAEDPNSPAPEKVLTRYQTGEKIPVFFNKEIDQRFLDAIEQIHNIIGFEVFEVQSKLAQIDVPKYSLTIDYKDMLPSKGGIIFSTGTAVELGMESHGSWSNTAHSYQSGFHIVNADNEYLVDGGWSWINIDTADDVGEASVELIAHELMHALGFSAHFEGFGIDGMFDNRAKAALRTLYNNPTGIEFDNAEFFGYPVSK